MNATVSDFMSNVTTYMAKVAAGEQVCLVDNGRIKARITPEPETNPAQGGPLADVLARARALKQDIAAQFGCDDDWSLQDYKQFGRR